MLPLKRIDESVVSFTTGTYNTMLAILMSSLPNQSRCIEKLKYITRKKPVLAEL